MGKNSVLLILAAALAGTLFYYNSDFFLGKKAPECSSAEAKAAVIEQAQKNIRQKLQGVDMLIGLAKLGNAQDQDIKDFLGAFGTSDQSSKFLLDKKAREKALDKENWQVRAVRTQKEDEKARSCSCSAVLVWSGPGEEREFPVSYAVELTDKPGEVYVKLEEFMGR
ncbi:MAG: hypothetical protein J6I40_08285 [Mailhella sp.]|nr:hypothetical protein [Mailhella sp.]